MGIAGLCPGTVMPPVIAALMMTFSMTYPFRRTNIPPINVKDLVEPPQTRYPLCRRRPGRYFHAPPSGNNRHPSLRRQPRRGKVEHCKVGAWNHVTTRRDKNAVLRITLAPS